MLFLHASAWRSHVFDAGDDGVCDDADDRPAGAAGLFGDESFGFDFDQHFRVDQLTDLDHRGRRAACSGLRVLLCVGQ
jgi:hypothetical protein